MARCPSCQEDFEGPEHECRSGPSSDQIEDAVAFAELDAELDATPTAAALRKHPGLQSLIADPAIPILANSFRKMEVLEAVAKGERRLCGPCHESLLHGGDLCDSCLNGTDEDGS